MKSAVETLSPTRAKLTVEVPFEELKPSLDAAYKQIAKQINVPGFRRGKVPPQVIDKQVGRGAVFRVVNYSRQGQVAELGVNGHLGVRTGSGAAVGWKRGGRCCCVQQLPAKI